MWAKCKAFTVKQGDLYSNHDGFKLLNKVLSDRLDMQKAWQKWFIHKKDYMEVL
jgi:hypothetical protein